MVYDSDFYTTRRPYRSSPAYSSYTSSKREIPWEKVPFVPRPSLVPDPITAFGKRSTRAEEQQRPERRSILHPEERAKIKPKAHLEPVQPYLSARDKSREKIFSNILRRELAPNADNMDVVLPRLHKVAECPDLPYKRKMVAYSDLPPSPRHYVVTDTYPDRSQRSAEEVYSYSYNSSSDSSSRSGDPYSRPQVRSSSTVESVTRSSGGGPGGYSYTSERSSRSRGDGPGGYHSSYSSTTSGNLPGGTSYRHWSYRV